MTCWVDGSVSFIGLVEARNPGGEAERSCSLRHYVAEIQLVGVPGPASPLHRTSLDIGMPTILRHGRWRFFFYSNEGSEPAHVHVEAAEGGQVLAHSRRSGTLVGAQVRRPSIRREIREAEPGLPDGGME